MSEEVKENIPEGWVPRTELGKKVYSGEITDIDYIFREGLKISEPEIVDVLLPNLENEIILIGGSSGKGGGIRRTIIRRTTRMHKSGRRYRTSALTVVGNRDGYIGIGFAHGQVSKTRELLAKSLKKAKLNLIPIKRGCGSWECGCGEPHSIPFAVEGKCGSVRVKLMPAPKGIGLCVSDEVKKLISLAGISDIWCKTRGNTRTRLNLIGAVFDALKKLNRYKLDEEFEKKAGIKVGRVV
ncbi:MAG: 30S ribosomal protein S5 [Candidatus Micrarchaeota archaeon]|nr:30S ribosomal protein S5 [Candidatus Micrarchaeota archaeon]